MKGWKDERFFLPGMILLGFLVRLVYVLTLEPRIIWYDGEEYSRLAAGLVHAGRYLDLKGRPSAYWPPGYPLFLAAIYALFGVSVTAVRVAQSLLGGVAVGLVYSLGRRAFGRDKTAGRAAFLAAAVTAFYPLFIYSAGAFFPVTLQIALLTGAVLLCHVAVEKGIERDPGWRPGAAAAAAGILSGYAVLTAASALPAVLCLAPWIVWAARRRASEASYWPETGFRRVPWLRMAVRSAALFLAGLVVVVGAWALRNERVFGRAVLASNNGGYNLWLGNYPGVDASTGSRMDLPDMKEESDRIWGSTSDEVERDQAFASRARQYIKEDPARFAGLSLRKALGLWSFVPQPMTQDRPRLGNEGQGLETLAIVLSYGLLLPFAVFWLLASLKRSVTAPLVLALFLAFTAVHAVVLSKVRFRLPLDPLLILYGSAGIVALWERLRRRGRPERGELGPGV